MGADEEAGQVLAAAERLLQIIPHLRLAVKGAAEQGHVKIGILAVKPDGGGQVVCAFEAGDFVEDLALVLGAPEETEDSELEAKAKQFLDLFGTPR